MSIDRTERPKILYLSHAPDDFYDLIRDVAGPDFELVTLETDSEEERIKKASDADGIIVAASRLNAPVIEAAKRVRVIHHQGVGYQDTIDMEALARTDATLAINPVGTTVGVAEHTLLLTLATLRRLAFADSELRHGRWHINSLRLESGELQGRTIGYIGMGRIAQAAAARFAAFGTDGIYYDPHATLDAATASRLGVRQVALDALLAEADVITLHIPLTHETRHMIGARELAAMKRSAILVNTARGPIVDEIALIDALRNSTIGGAGLDVFEEEPPIDTPLADFRNVVLTPHISAGTRDALQAKMEALFDNLRRFFNDQPIANNIDFPRCKDRPSTC
ncbi:NAD(P)-dependent oxidoreductase [Oricola indica]|jgi:phosphoglycerate dehydrogenase-like enzyme|uniref:NAD(P)-dependent oxidoreductase n=1 Tax=Oricola indica TaxID=2872591 RepID=UPI001CC0C219|nr:NAD(P)-dependent oxidoreductase [Oricola indica]